MKNEVDWLRFGPPFVDVIVLRIFSKSPVLAARVPACEVSHDLGRPLNETSACQWIDVPDELYLADIKVSVRAEVQNSSLQNLMCSYGDGVMV